MDQLPNEILIRILGHLSTYDLLQFCLVFKDRDYFLREKHVTSTSDWSRRFESQNINICKFITIEMNPGFIRVLKMNGIYWIPGEDCRRLISKLPLLEELHAVDTKLGFKDKYIMEYQKLKKLAISIEDDDLSVTCTARASFPSLKYLYFKILLKKDQQLLITRLQTIFSCLTQLKELWIQDESDSTINYESFIVRLRNLHKLVIKSKGVLPMYNFSYMDLSKTFDCKRCNTKGELIFEKVLKRKSRSGRSIFEPRETEIEKSWDIFESLHAYLPCGTREHKLLYLGEEVKNIQFDELNFCHTVILCNSKYVDAALQILNSENCSSLKKLNFRSCLFQNFQPVQKQDSDALLFKKARVGVKQETKNHPFEKTSRSLKNLLELEIFSCPGCNGGPVVSAYPLISNFENLRKLSLEVPLLLDGTFLEVVLKKCQNLEYLNLTLTAQNEKFMLNLYQYLKYAISMKDFRLVCSTVNVEKLFTGLCQNANRKLLRFFVKCDNIAYAATSNERALFASFLEQNPQLVFFFLAASQSTAKQISSIQKIFHEYKKGNPVKIFYCKKDVDKFTGAFPIPPAHHDIIFGHTRVSVIDFDQF